MTQIEIVSINLLCLSCCGWKTAFCDFLKRWSGNKVMKREDKRENKKAKGNDNNKRNKQFVFFNSFFFLAKVVNKKKMFFLSLYNNIPYFFNLHLWYCISGMVVVMMMIIVVVATAQLFLMRTCAHRHFCTGFLHSLSLSRMKILCNIALN